MGHATHITGAATRVGLFYFLFGTFISTIARRLVAHSWMTTHLRQATGQRHPIRILSHLVLGAALGGLISTTSNETDHDTHQKFSARV